MSEKWGTPKNAESPAPKPDKPTNSPDMVPTPPESVPKRPLDDAGHAGR